MSIRRTPANRRGGRLTAPLELALGLGRRTTTPAMCESAFAPNSPLDAHSHSHSLRAMASFFERSCRIGLGIHFVRSPSHRQAMALPFVEKSSGRDLRALSILAKSIYRELRASGYETRDVISLASELLAQVTTDVKLNR